MMQPAPRFVVAILLKRSQQPGSLRAMRDHGRPRPAAPNAAGAAPAALPELFRRGGRGRSGRAAENRAESPARYRNSEHEATSETLYFLKIRAKMPKIQEPEIQGFFCNYARAKNAKICQNAPPVERFASSLSTDCAFHRFFCSNSPIAPIAFRKTNPTIEAQRSRCRPLCCSATPSSAAARPAARSPRRACRAHHRSPRRWLRRRHSTPPSPAPLRPSGLSGLGASSVISTSTGGASRAVGIR